MRKLFVIPLALLMLAACKPVTPVPSTSPAAAPATATLADTLGNLSYTGIFDDQPITLTHGIYAYTEPDSAARPVVRLLDRLIAQGDLNGDGTEDAVALIEHDSSGTGRFTYAVPVLNVTTAPAAGTALWLGDRIQVKSLAIADGQVVAESIAQGPGDGQCCPTWNVRDTFAWQDGALVESSREELSKISWADLNGTSWRLVDLNGGEEPVLPDSEITLQIDGDQVSGSGGCNNYNAGVTSQADAPQSISVSQIATTMMMCPEPIANQETAYLKRLGSAVTWGYEGGTLVIVANEGDNAVARLMFEPVATATAPAATATATATAETTTMTQPSTTAALDAIPDDDFALFQATNQAALGAISDAVEKDCLATFVPGGISFPLAEPDYNAKRPLVFDAFAGALDGFTSARAAALDTLLTGKTIPEIEALMDDGKLSAVELVTYYVDRIQRFDVDKLNSVMELNPSALAIAAQLDAERAAGTVRGPLHGIPVLFKDNIATGDQMHTTAGTYALKDWRADRDAFLVQKLRNAGAIILGKANLSEWANYMDPCMPSGFSVLGGQTRHPYGPFDPLGSSSGSAVSVAANLTTISVGSETSGSLIQPARVNSVVGLRPSQGLISRDHIVPLGPDLDTPGPMGRSVTDVALLLNALAGVDANDIKTVDAASLAGVDFTKFLSLGEARKVRVGVIIPTNQIAGQLLGKATLIAGITGKQLSSDEQAALLVDEVLPALGGDPQIALDALKKLGIEVVEIDDSTLPPSIDTAQTLLPYSFNAGVADFFAKLDTPAPITSLADVVTFNKEDMANRAPYGMRFVEASANNTMTAEEYTRLRAVAQALANHWMKSTLESNNVDILVSGVSYAGNAGAAGVPALTIPAGLDPKGEPQGIILSGDYLSEPKLFAVGYALEQAIHGRIEPDLDATLKQIETVTGK